MTHDPREGVAPDGTVVTGVDVDRIPDRYRPLVDDAVTALRRALGPALRGVRLYGSVATGQATPPTSDLDLIALLGSSADADAARAAITEVAATLSSRHADHVREVAIAVGDLDTLARPDRVGWAERCFLRHYSVHLDGDDVAADYPPCAATADLAVGFDGSLAAVLRSARGRLAAATSGEERDAVTVRACRKLLLAAATLLSVREGSWSTDRARGAALLERHAPATLRPHVAAAVSWSAGRPDRSVASAAVLDDLGGWLVDAYAALGPVAGGDATDTAPDPPV